MFFFLLSDLSLYNESIVIEKRIDAKISTTKYVSCVLELIQNLIVLFSRNINLRATMEACWKWKLVEPVVGEIDIELKTATP